MTLIFQGQSLAAIRLDPDAMVAGGILLFAGLFFLVKASDLKRQIPEMSPPPLA